MCGFAGFADFSQPFPGQQQHWMDLARSMARRIAHRGPDGHGASFSPHCVLAHARLAVMDPQHGQQPLSLPWQGHQVSIAYNGEVYNAPQLRGELEALGFSFASRCDTEVVLASYLAWGPPIAHAACRASSPSPSTTPPPPGSSSAGTPSALKPSSSPLAGQLAFARDQGLLSCRVRPCG